MTKALKAHSAHIIALTPEVLRRRVRVLPSFLPANIASRIDALTDKSQGPNGDWVWLGSRMQSNGYPQITFKNAETGRTTTMNVHRVLMCIELGRKLQTSEYVLHAQGHPDSVNPIHLRIGSQRDNIADAKAEGRHNSKRTSKADVLAIVRLYQVDGASIPDIAHRFGVNNTTVRKIVRGQSHAKLTGIKRATNPAKGRRKVS